jgi:tRNA G18 (ribose-2'-O)-methylase SpoU
MAPEILQVTKRNAAFQRLHSLLDNRQKRHAARRFLVEGVQPLNTARAHDWRFAATIVPRGARLSPWAAAFVEEAAAPVRYEMSTDLLREISRKDETSELIGVVEMPADDMARIPLSGDLLVAVIDRPSNPGNLGTMIRSCDAFGVHGLIVTGHAVDPYDPATVTASRGSIFAVPVVRIASHAGVGAWLTQVRESIGTCQMIGADEAAERPLFAHDFRPPTVAVFGNERHGLSHAYREMCDVAVRIPILGSATSLNVGVAASVLFYEVSRQRST